MVVVKNIKLIKVASLFLGLAMVMVLFQCKPQAAEKALIPIQSNKFVWIYNPSGDTFFGPNTKNLREGMWYDNWVPNDHTFVKDEEGKWHIFGITHPLVKTDPLDVGIHEGEYASFHAVSSANSFAKSLKKHHYTDLEKVLSPKDRPEEALANHAPYVFMKDGVYQMIYGPSPIRLAQSSDLINWETKGELFSDKDGARDPNVLFHHGKYYVVYCSTKSVRITESDDLITWSKPKTILKTSKFDPESPSLIFFNDTFYLFVCSWDGNWDKKEIQGAYQHKTYVYNAQDLLNFGVDDENEITTFNAHAPEIFQDETGQWYISSVEWPNRGVSIDSLSWETN